ncbi:helix-turn-helix domain-containing protein [Paenibacillus daejeonensis]|uniref:helix-turn-helix domain-containing protein n=1 Tax=Paenibacillus daejeonensis TaxID=135193 RepID=UPI000379F3E2|nr:AraC family transcriptional regulator [Paenibacillus daejeonensis]
MDNHDSHEAGRLFHFDNLFGAGEASYGMIDLRQIGEIACERGYEIALHPQVCMELSYIVSGSGTFQIGDTVLQVRAGDLVFNNPGYDHAIQAGASDMLRFVYMGFNFNETADPSFAELRSFLASAPYHMARDTHHMLMPFMRGIDEFYTQQPYAEPMVRNSCEGLLIAAYRSFTGSAGHAAPQRTPHSVGHTVYSVIRYVENHILELKSIQGIAADLNYNATYLSHAFKNKTGMTLQRYINHKKIEKSLELLGYGHLSIGHVAEQLGYETIQSFSKAFSRIMGYPPSRYVAEQRQSSKG